MEISEVSRSLRQLWENKPGILILLCIGFVGFVVLVVDTWRHRRRRKRPR
jgi:hypothetical protein